MKQLGVVLGSLLIAACAQQVVAPIAAPAITDTRDYRPADLNAISAPAPTLREVYGSESPVQFGDLRVPEGNGPFPVAMLVHGGCWNNLGSINNFGPMAAWLADNGVATWNVDYRELQNGGGWPTTFVDWAGALSRLRGLAQRYPLDLDRITVIGHSAGTTAAVWLGTGDHGDFVLHKDLPHVRAGVLLDGPVSMASWIGPDAEICRNTPVIVPFMGGTPAEVPDRYGVVEPLSNPLKLKKLLFVAGALPPPPDGMLEAIGRQGVDTSRIDLDGTSHFNMLVPGTKDFAAIAPAILQVAKGR